MKRTLWPWAGVAAGLWIAAGPAGAAGPEKEKEKAPAAELRVEAKRAKQPVPLEEERSCAGNVNRGLFDGPVAIGFLGADYATGRRACARTEVGLGLLGGAIIDTADFYGALSGGAVLYGSYALAGPPVEIFGTLELVKVQYVQNASLKGTSVSLGQATVGATYALLRMDRLTLAPSVRLTLPTDSSTPDVLDLGLELGGAASWNVWGPIELHGYAGGDVSAGLSDGPALARPGFLLSVGTQLSFFSWGGAVIDLNLHAGPAAYLAPSAGLRFTVAKVVGVELAGTMPVWGTLRNDGAVGLKVAYRL